MPYPRDIRIIDTLLDLPREDRAAKERFANLRDADSLKGEGGHPAGYLFKDTPEERTPGADPIGDTLRAMDRHGIETAVFNLTRDGWTETEVRAARTHPARFRPVLQVDPNTGMDAVRAITKAHAELGIVGITLFPVGYVPPVPINDKRMYPLYAKCVELDVAFQTQVGHTGPLYPSETGRPLYIDEVALDFPELRIVCGHIGWPWTEEMIAVAWKHKNVFIDTSAHLPKHFPERLVYWMQRQLQDKVMYASDYPLVPFERILGQIDEHLKLTPEVKKKYLCDNARRAFKL